MLSILVLLLAIVSAFDCSLFDGDVPELLICSKSLFLRSLLHRSRGECPSKLSKLKPDGHLSTSISRQALLC